jgi:hypothetical protein
MQGIIPQTAAVGATAPMDVRGLAFALANMEPDLWAPVRPGEAWADVLARRDAARDILDELLAEAAEDVDPEDVDRAKTRVFDMIQAQAEDEAVDTCMVCGGSGGRS